jgi:RNA polymerase sigma-32 factor
LDEFIKPQESDEVYETHAQTKLSPHHIPNIYFESHGKPMSVYNDDNPLADEVVGGRIDGERRLQWLSEALQTLNERELQIVRARQLQDETKTLETLGVELGISKERVRQIESRALDKLKRNLLTRHSEASLSASGLPTLA